MSFAEHASNVTQIRSVDTVVVEKVRWSLRQRLRRQMHLLCTDFFDATDDFLFGGGQQGQFAENGLYLKAMRELRARQAHFEEVFLDTAIARVKASYGRDPNAAEGKTVIRADAAMEAVEIDLALQAVARKAEKVHLQMIRQIDSVQRKVRVRGRDEIIGSRVVLQATLVGFAEAQAVLTLPVEIRLVFIKLFEQHFILKMEKLFLDIISIITNIKDPAFVEKLYSSSSAFRTTSAPHRNTLMVTATAETKTVTKLGGDNVAVSANSESVRSAVDQLLSELLQGVAPGAVPDFVRSMLRKHWHGVMFVIGVNRGVGGVEWNEASHAATFLVTVMLDQLALSLHERQHLLERLRQGFALVQSPLASQEEFFQQLDSALDQFSQPPSIAAETATAPESKLEASISPSGEQMLDKDDLDEIAQLLGGGEGEARSLDDCIAQLDACGDQTVIELLIEGKYKPCKLQRDPTDATRFTIQQQPSSAAVSRSRLGLAIALKAGELRLPEAGEEIDTTPDTLVVKSTGTRS